MKKNICIIIFLSLCLGQNKLEILNSIKDSIDSSIPDKCIIFNIPEAMPKLENYFFYQSLSTKASMLNVFSHFKLDKIKYYADTLSNEIKNKILFLENNDQFDNEDEFLLSILSETAVIKIKYNDLSLNDFLNNYYEKYNLIFDNMEYLDLCLKNHLNTDFIKENLKKILDSKSFNYIEAIAIYLKYFNTDGINYLQVHWNLLKNNEKILLFYYLKDIYNQQIVDFIIEQLITNNEDELIFVSFLKDSQKYLNLKRIYALTNYFDVSGVKVHQYTKRFVYNYIHSKPDSSVTVGEMLDSLKSYNQECYKIKWIKSEVLFQKLGALINNTETAISENKIKVATINLQQIINLVEASDSSQINKLGIKFIKYPAKYLWERIVASELYIPQLYAEVRFRFSATDSKNIFEYTISNLDSSNISVGKIYLKTGSGYSSIDLPYGWTGETVLPYIILKCQNASSAIKPGTNSIPIKINTNSLPGIGYIYLQSNFGAVDTTKLDVNSVKIETIIPIENLRQLSAKEFLQTLISFNDYCSNKKYYRVDWAYNVQKTALNNSLMMLKLNVPASSLVMMQQFRSTMEYYHNNNFLTDEGYFLLKANVLELIKKLEKM